MASVNKAIIVGNLGKDPEVRYMTNGDALANIAVATTESWKDKATGEKKEATEWHKIVFRGKLAEIAGKYLKKGSAVYIEGRIRTRKWQDKEGQERYTTEIEAREMQMLGGKSVGDDSATPRPAESPQQRNVQGAQGGAFADMDDDIPFNHFGACGAWRAI